MTMNFHYETTVGLDGLVCDMVVTMENSVVLTLRHAWAIMNVLSMVVPFMNGPVVHVTIAAGTHCHYHQWQIVLNMKLH